MKANVYPTLKDARNAFALDSGFDPFIHGPVKDRAGQIWTKPTKAAMAALGYSVSPVKEDD